MSDYHKERILILVKTYPNLSSKYDETVCIAGVNSNGEWRRLYPVRFRKMPYEKRFKKWTWIEVDVMNYTNREKCKRKESYKTNDETIKILEHIDSKNWEKRNNLLFGQFHLLNKSMEELFSLRDQSFHDAAGCISLGMIKPKEIIGFTITPSEEARDWERDLIEGKQSTLNEIFTGNKYSSPLDKIPYRFGYTFTCNDSSCKGHDIMCEDWELLESYRSWKHKYRSEQVLMEKLKEKFLTFMKERNTHFIVGTESRFNKFLIIGLYYPPF